MVYIGMSQIHPSNYINLVISEEERRNKLKQLCSRSTSVLIHACPNRSVKLTFPRDIGKLSQNGSITSEMVRSSIGQGIGLLKRALLVLVAQRQYISTMALCSARLNDRGLRSRNTVDLKRIMLH